MQVFVIVAVVRRANPLVPMQVRGDGLRRRPPADAATAARRPTIRLGDVADSTTPNVLAKPADPFGAMSLVAQLSRHLVLLLGRHEPPHLLNAVGHWLFQIHALAQAHGHCRSEGMMVVGRGDKYRVDVFVHRVEHPSVVEKRLDARQFQVRTLLADPFHALGHVLVVHVDQRDQLLGDGRGDATDQALVCGADHNGAQLRVGRPFGQNVGHFEKTGPSGHAGQRSSLEKLAAIVFHGENPRLSKYWAGAGR